MAAASGFVNDAIDAFARGHFRVCWPIQLGEICTEYIKTAFLAKLPLVKLF